MDAAELDVQLDELEIRVERLRALYEQYFLGIEKIEPAVPRKDVERRIYVLRREKIRNTAKRFKLQTIIQRYNTFQQYWQRICREIENGTYRRHVIRAERAFGGELQTIAARKRLGRDHARAPEAEAAASEPTLGSAPPAAASSSPPAPVTSAPAPVTSAPAPVTSAPAPKRTPPPLPRRSALAPPRTQRPPQQFESLDLDMGFLGDWDPAESVRRPQPKAASTNASARQAVEPKAPTSPPARPALEPAARPAAVPAATAAAVKRATEQKPKAAQAAAPVPLNDDRIKELHARLNDLKRQNQEAGQVPLERLAQSLRATEEKLRKQHSGRRIDFDVVVKDGKAVVKPIVR